MKRVRLVLGAFAFFFAFVTSFAFKAVPDDPIPAYVNSSSQCIQVSADCPGGETACRQFVPATGQTEDILQFDDILTCTPQLKMAP
jgi:hypothetical protein